MKKLFFLLLVSISCIEGYAQQDPGAAVLKNIQTRPTFNIHIVPDSTLFSSDELKKNEPLVFIFFNPDCDHCQKETKQLLAYKDELKNIPILMVSPSPFAQIRTFYEDYNLASMPNVKMGQDLNYVLGLKYRPTNYPAIFVYDAKGNLAKAFVGNAGVPTIIDALK